MPVLLYAHLCLVFLALAVTAGPQDAYTIFTTVLVTATKTIGDSNATPAPSAHAAAPYQLLRPHLDTPWTDKVGTSPWPQYPRPQLRREPWRSLNGIWTYQSAQGAGDVKSPPRLPLRQEVLIPSCIESGISGIMTEGMTHMWFGTTFTIPPEWRGGKRVLLNFEAVDYEATVFINGVQLAFHRGGYFRFSLDVTEKINFDGPNELQVFVFDPTDDQSIPQGKQTKRLSHIFYTPCSVTFTVHSSQNQSTPVSIEVSTKSGEVIGRYDAESDRQFVFNVPGPQLWSPETPTLYNVTVKMGDDLIESYTGFRTISTGVVNGIKRPLLNGKFVYLFGPLDQGYWPDGLHLPPTLEAMVYDLELIKSLGMNLVRKHIKIEPDLFYEACDRLGLLVMQDMPSMRVHTNARPTDAEQAEFERQLEIMIKEHRNYPSIVTWVIYNEGWGQITDRYPEFHITDRIRQLDPTRLINSVTGWHDHGAGDYHDNHHYADPQCGTPFYSLPNTPYDSSRIGFQGEYGGLGHRPLDEHLWPVQAAVRTINETYEMHADEASYNYRAHVLFDLLRQQVEHFACSGAVYTQTSDVEGEVNGLVTYDRRVVRVDVTQWKADIQALYDAAAARA
ncbi:Putative Glycoside Hydrolase Family 2 [Podospora comata]|uniref:Glycoside Hydrolase Family 2 n=2 Tax=Podospora TaxID=5144 RepID=A0ABY6RYI6_PODCO|nr:Putative Glycoside Hydrolase Family 2 [Podospora comata]